MARQMQTAGTPAQHLVVLDTPAPSGSGGRVPGDLDLLIEILHLLERYDGRARSAVRAELSALTPAARGRAARDRLIESDVLGGAAGSLDLAAMVAVARAHQVARNTYRPQPHAGSVTIIRAASPTSED